MQVASLVKSGNKNTDQGSIHAAEEDADSTTHALAAVAVRKACIICQFSKVNCETMTEG